MVESDSSSREPASDTGELFRFFVMQHQMTAMVYLGKVVHPASGEIERNLEGARLSIDLLGMLEEKTRGNLTADESKLLEQVLTNLRLNFIEEVKREREKEKQEKEGKAKARNGEQGADKGQEKREAEGGPSEEETQDPAD